MHELRTDFSTRRQSKNIVCGNITLRHYNKIKLSNAMCHESKMSHPLYSYQHINDIYDNKNGHK